MRILITGGTGFLGRALVSKAIDAGHEVLVLSRNDHKVSAGAWLATGGMDKVPWNEIENFRPETCIHCAWITTPGEYLVSVENDRLCGLSLEFANGLHNRGAKKFVGVGTCLEYEEAATALNEEAAPVRSPTRYAASKIRLRMGLGEIFNKPGSMAWMRIFYTYGPGAHPDRLIGTFLKKAASGGRLLLQRPEDIVDYIHVDDIACALLLAATSGMAGSFNIGSGEPLSLRDLANKIEEVSGRSDVFEFGEQGDRVCRYADISRLRGFGWEPKYSLPEGLRTVLQDSLNVDT